MTTNETQCTSRNCYYIDATLTHMSWCAIGKEELRESKKARLKAQRESRKANKLREAQNA